MVFWLVENLAADIGGCFIIYEGYPFRYSHETNVFVHPHTCGADPNPSVNNPMMDGSSPHMWGRRWRRVYPHTGLPVHPHTCGADHKWCSQQLSGHRFIPTHVGQTFCSPHRHPHSFGSSPHMWGRPPTIPSADRNIPVHPHTCGADHILSFRTRSQPSVHPHTCGADALQPSFQGLRPRFIPTHVGQTSSARPRLRSASVHPHTCGADYKGGPVLYQLLPVHPHTCGADLSTPPILTGIPRFIPTHVGQTLSYDEVFCVYRFIPTHVGQTTKTALNYGIKTGSSPHMWGRLSLAQRFSGVHRFIPTHVGQTSPAT